MKHPCNVLQLLRLLFHFGGQEKSGSCNILKKAHRLVIQSAVFIILSIPNISLADLLHTNPPLNISNNILEH